MFVVICGTLLPLIDSGLKVSSDGHPEMGHQPPAPPTSIRVASGGGSIDDGLSPGYCVALTLADHGLSA